jgi:serine phosphatase RsbU (regulator of sigma subunit)
MSSTRGGRGVVDGGATGVANGDPGAGAGRADDEWKRSAMWATVLADAAVRLGQCPPFALPDVVEAALRTVDPGAECRVHLADYRMDRLWPVRAGEDQAVPIEGSDLGRCLAGQEPLRPAGDRTRAIVPITAHGDRLGVLAVRCPDLLGDHRESAAVAETLQELARLGTVLAASLLAADLATDRFRVARRGRALTLAAEIQWEKLPGRSLDTGFARLAGQLEPAYTVIGDTYDWVADPSGVTAFLIDGSGHGVSAADTTSFTVSALRNARREGADLGGTARMADQALYSRWGGEVFASCVLMDLDPVLSRLSLILAGSGTVVVADRTSVRRPDVERHPPLGVDEEYPYRAVGLPLRPGDRVVAVTDGLTDAQVDGPRFGDELERVVQRYRLLGAAELVRAVIRDLERFHGGRPQQDDAVILCLDVPGGPAG